MITLIALIALIVIQLWVVIVFWPWVVSFQVVPLCYVVTSWVTTASPAVDRRERREGASEPGSVLTCDPVTVEVPASNELPPCASLVRTGMDGSASNSQYPRPTSWASHKCAQSHFHALFHARMHARTHIYTNAITHSHAQTHASTFARRSHRKVSLWFGSTYSNGCGGYSFQMLVSCKDVCSYLLVCMYCFYHAGIVKLWDIRFEQSSQRHSQE